ncbi:hypothetical protein [Niallia sp. FSL R7-0271]|uniref:hypothetical protein n=1 Tax=Niallia sp. FSL R7-0271 TaxID=2921678 RepID=UPI004048D237
MEQVQLFLDLIKAGNHAFNGWDFLYLSETGRTASAMLSWSYGSLALQQISKCERNSTLESHCFSCGSVNIFK